MTSRDLWSSTAVVLTLAFMFGAGPACDGCGEDAGGESASAEASGDESGASGESAKEQSSADHKGEGSPLLVELGWSEYADLDLQLVTPPDESGERGTVTFGNPGPGGGGINYDNGCSAHRCDPEDSPYRETAYWDEGRDEPLAGKYDLRPAETTSTCWKSCPFELAEHVDRCLMDERDGVPGDELVGPARFPEPKGGGVAGVCPFPRFQPDPVADAAEMRSA